MEVHEYLQHFIGVLHKGYEDAIADLTPAQFSWRPHPATNHIGFTAWHWVRTEDNIVQFVLQRQQTTWLAGGLDEKWGLPRIEQGTGMAPDQAHEMKLPPVDEFLDYSRKVWEATGRYIAAVTKEDLDRITRVQPFGEIPVLQVLGQTLIAHGNQHLGEIWLNRELQGLKGIGF